MLTKIPPDSYESKYTRSDPTRFLCVAFTVAIRAALDAQALRRRFARGRTQGGQEAGYALWLSLEESDRGSFGDPDPGGIGR